MNKFNFFRFIVTVQHECGTVKIAVTASNKNDARAIVASAENCPMSAIIQVQKGK